LFAVLAEPAALTGPAVDRQTHVIRRTTDVLMAELPYVTLLLRVRGNSATELAALKRRREFDRLVTDLLVQAQREGQVRADIDPATATRLIFGMINSLTEWYRPRTPSATLPDQVVRLIMDGLTRR
jgi:hypothetical protein